MKKNHFIYEIIAIVLSAFVFIATLASMNAHYADMKAMERGLKFIKVVKGLGIADIVIGIIAMIKKEGFSVFGIASVLLSSVSVAYIGISSL